MRKTDVLETRLWSTENFAKERAEYIILSVVEGTLFKDSFQSIGRDT